MAINLVALVAAVAGLGAVGVASLITLQRDLDASLTRHEQWRSTYERFLYDVGTPILQARRTLGEPAGDVRRSVGALRQAAGRLDAMALGEADPTLAPAVDQARAALRRVIGTLERDANGADPAQLAADLNIAFNVAAELSRRMQQTLGELQAEATQRTTDTMVMTGGIGLVIVLVAVIAGVVQHRSVVRPLRRIGDGVDRFAAGRFDERLDAAGDDELASLARQFNHMADELESLYRDLEQRVRDTSRRLVQSERLASVGYLAAGVAHEINNPLAIIAGQAELALRRMTDAEPACEKLQVIRDEAFRCKAITQKLLSLSRGETGQRQVIDLRSTVRDVAAMVTALPRWGERSIDVRLGEAALNARADASQIKQVLLNLLTNAMAATGERGRITIFGRRDDSHVVVEVSDDGKGMDEAARSRVFEPFYTDQRGTNEPGTGLGLSISHAIVADHAGTLNVHSEGPNRGSTFTMRLPAGH